MPVQVAQLLERIERQTAALPPEHSPPDFMRLPLVRLKVDHAGFATLANQRFGS
ncbi:hypothetical protein EON66_12075 [archaeon]|nr:MAG: hypothetical protein EON66_12075 [archaeon]